MAEQVADSGKDKDILRDALDRFEESQDGTDFNRSTYEEDIDFSRLGNQWDEKIQKVRQKEGRPCLTINKMPSFIRQVVNDSRQNKPGIIVNPVDNGADKDTAEVINGIIRSIERNSNAGVAYDTGIDNSASGGFGFWRVNIEFANEDSFDLVARINRIPNALAVHWDPNTTEFDASDWNYAFVSDFLTEEEFEETYPDAEKVSFEGMDSGPQEFWLEEDKIRVAEYWLKTQEERKLLMLSDGMVIREDEIPRTAKAFFAAGGIDIGAVSDDELTSLFFQAKGASVKRERTVKASIITRRIISGVEVLEEDPWPGTMIPVVPVWGEEVWHGGKRYLRSMVRDARPAQEMVNFWRSASTELVALAPRAPWVGPKGFVPKGHESIWETANTRSHSKLEYDPTKGPAPERQPFAGVPAGAIQEGLNASDDMKSIMGIFDASLGARGNETSGKAILARQRESDVSNFHFIDNLSRAIQYTGRILVEIIPSVYSGRQTMRIVGADEKEKVVKLATGQLQPDKQSSPNEKLYDLNVGTYDVSVKAGPSYASQREETREALVEIMSRVPGAGAFIGDIVLEHMDFQNADKVAKRLKLLLPPEVQKAEAEENIKDVPPEAQAIITQMQNQLQQMQGQLQEAQKNAAQNKLDIEKLNVDKGKLQLEREKAEHSALMAESKLQMEQDKMTLETIDKLI